MITRQGHIFLVSCDSCGYEEEFDADDYDFEDVVAEIKYDGWVARKTKKREWRNYCPDCALG